MTMKFPLNLANASKKDLPFVKASLRRKVPLLTLKQIRRLKLPLVDALKIELEEGNHKKGLKLFNEILDIDKNHLKCFVDGDNLMLLEEIFNSLKEVDNKTEEEEISILIKTIRRIFAENENFDWLIALLIIRGYQIIADHNLEGSKIYTILAYLHGLSLSHRLRWYRAALLQFESAFEIALNNNDWTYDDENIYVKISQDLSECLIKLSKQIRVDENNINEALIYARRALTILRARQIKENLKHEIYAETEYGNCCFDLKNFNEAREHFEHGLALSENFDLRENYCECLIKIAKCHKGIGNTETYKMLLLITKDYAHEHTLMQHLEHIFILLMEFYMENFNIQKVGEIFHQAFDCFMNIDDQEKLVELEILFAHASAKMNYNQVVDAVLKADKSQAGDNSYLQKLIAWIDQKSSKALEDDHSEDLSFDEFIKKYYDPDEITKLERYTI